MKTDEVRGIPYPCRVEGWMEKCDTATCAGSGVVVGAPPLWEPFYVVLQQDRRILSAYTSEELAANNNNNPEYSRSLPRVRLDGGGTVNGNGGSRLRCWAAPPSITEEEAEDEVEEDAVSLRALPAQDEPPVVQKLPTPSLAEQLEDLPDIVEEEPQSATQNLDPVPGPSATAATKSTESAQQVGAASASAAPDDDVIDPDLLQAIGDFVPEAAEWGEDINDNLSKILSPILKDGLKTETKDELLKKYLLPGNCQLSKSPILNPEISAVLTDNSKNRDLRIHKKQNQLGCILSVLGKVITGMLKKSLDTPATLKLLSDAAKLVADSHFTETETRRALITPMLDKGFVEPFKDRKRDSHLFGDKLGEFIKSSRGIKKTGQLIQATSTSTSSLNWRGPPPRPFQRKTRRSLNRSGGLRAPPPAREPPRQRTAAAAPPPATRSAPAPLTATTRRSYAPPPTRRRI